MSYDVIVVGAGPAGSTAARECAARGLRTLIIDKAVFPRDKPCGGGVMVRAARALDVDISPVVERTVDTARLVRSNGRADSLVADAPLCLMTSRMRLDAHLLDQARRAGADVIEGTPVRGLEPGPDSTGVAIASGPVKARVVIAADGANGTTGRMAGLRPEFLWAVALEANLSPRGGVPREWERAGAVHSIGAPGGYGWVFPKGDHLNLGVAGWARVAPTLRRRLHAFAAACGLDPSLLEEVRGHHIPFRRNGSPLAAGRTMLVGDAAGVADPLTGDGIYGAAVSGKAAASAAFDFLTGAAPDLSGYERSMKPGLVASVRVAMQVHDLVHLGMDQFFWSLARAPLLWRVSCAIARGDSTYKSAKERLGPYGALIDLGESLVRVVPWLRRRAGRIDSVPPERPWTGRAAGAAGAMHHR